MVPEHDDDEFFARLIADHDAKQAKRKTHGHKLHSEMTKAFRAIEGCKFIRSWDDGIPDTVRPADIQVCLPPHGLSVLVECKETRVDRIDFARIDDARFSTRAKPNNQRRTLMLHAMSGGLSLIAVQRIYCNKSRTWLLSWQHWEALRRSLDRESIPLKDPDDVRKAADGRPTSLTEVGLLRSGDFYSRVMAIRAESLALPIIDYRKGDF